MDRDKRWDRTEAAYRAVVLGQGPVAPDAVSAVCASYERGEGDEFIVPTVLAAVAGTGPLIRSGDGAIFWNYRADRARQLCEALTEPEFDHFERGSDCPGGLVLASLTRYIASQRYVAAFPPQSRDHLLAEVWSSRGLSQ
jgi:2,3-bisphosphoglycerate-independent phosphoglycerate mutase